MRCEDIHMYILASVPPLAVLTHCHPTPGMVVVGAGVHCWWLEGGHLSDDSASRVVGDNHIMAVTRCEMGGQCWPKAGACGGRAHDSGHTLRAWP